MSIRIIAIALSAIVSAGLAMAEPQLLMVEQPGCVWCAQWDAEIGPIYEKTGEGQAAPLRRVDKTQPLPGDVVLLRPINFTPTFVLMVDGGEVARIEGYPGQDFFWGLLGNMLEAHDIGFALNPPAASPKS